MRRLLLLLTIAALATGCGHKTRVSQPPPGSHSSTLATTTAPTTSTAVTVQGHVAVRVYFLRDGKVAPVARTVTAPAVAVGALQQLEVGPTAAEAAQGFRSEVEKARSSVTITNSVATVDVTDTSHAGLAQIVYTLTQFPTVHGVRTSRMLGDSKPLTRADFEDVTPAILVESPLPGDTVTSPLRVQGTANTFEATFDLEIRNSSGVKVAWRFVTASSGSGTRGTYDTAISFPHTSGPITLVAYEPSAENGKPLHVVSIPLRER
jgi:immunoglobulin-like protein involved in spore germination/sporulation and spore germination protein